MRLLVVYKNGHVPEVPGGGCAVRLLRKKRDVSFFTYVTTILRAKRLFLRTFCKNEFETDVFCF